MEWSWKDEIGRRAAALGVSPGTWNLYEPAPVLACVVLVNGDEVARAECFVDGEAWLRLIRPGVPAAETKYWADAADFLAGEVARVVAAKQPPA